MTLTQDTEALDALEPVVTITTSDTRLLLPALLMAGASVTLRRDKLAVRGLTAAEVAGVAAAQLALVTDLTSSTTAPIGEQDAMLSGAAPAPTQTLAQGTSQTRPPSAAPR